MNTYDLIRTQPWLDDRAFLASSRACFRFDRSVSIVLFISFTVFFNSLFSFRSLSVSFVCAARLFEFVPPLSQAPMFFLMYSVDSPGRSGPSSYSPTRTDVKACRRQNERGEVNKDSAQVMKSKMHGKPYHQDHQIAQDSA